MAARKREVNIMVGDRCYIRRDARGRFAEVDDIGRSRQDRRRMATRHLMSGSGDRGDRRR